MRFSHVTVDLRHLCRWCSAAMTTDKGRHVVLYCMERRRGESVAVIPLPQV